MTRRVAREIKSDRLSLVAAGVAFYGFLSVFPALAAIISIWGLVADPAQVQQQIGSLEGAVPGAALQMIEGAATRIAAGSPTGLGLGVAISLALTLWSANKGMKGLVTAINIAYDEDDRGFFGQNAVSLGLTLGAIVVTILAIALVVVLPAALGALGLGAVAEWAIRLGRWPLLAVLIVAALAIIYRVGPNREISRWRWVSPGSIVAALLWIAASVLFSTYVENFGSYDKTFGSVAAVAIMLIWFFISSFAALVGAEINSEAEKLPRREPATVH